MNPLLSQFFRTVPHNRNEFINFIRIFKPCNMKIQLLYLPLIALLLTNCEKKTVADVAVVSEEATSKVLDHHWEAFKANDLEATMADYTDESVLITPDKTYKGLKEIRENFIFAFSVFPKDSSTLKLNKSVVQQDVGYIIWEASAPKLKLSFGTDTFIIQNGKIIRQTYAGVAAP